MNRDEFEGNWHQIKGKIQERWGKFTHDEIARMNGKYEQFLGLLQKKYGYTMEQAEREMKNWWTGPKMKGEPSKTAPELWSESSPSELAAHERLAHEDKDPIYPIDSDKEERSRGQSSENRDVWKSKDRNKHNLHSDEPRHSGRDDQARGQGPGNQVSWEPKERNNHKKKDEDHKDKKRKAG